MSNYPPGVTGNEWQIAGPDFERDEFKECPMLPGISIKTITDYGESTIKAALGQLSEGNVLSARSYLHQALGDIQDAETDSPCGWTGEVTVWGYAGIVSWECPLCRRTHEEEMES